MTVKSLYSYSARRDRGPGIAHGAGPPVGGVVLLNISSDRLA